MQIKTGRGKQRPGEFTIGVKDRRLRESGIDTKFLPIFFEKKGRPCGRPLVFVIGSGTLPGLDLRLDDEVGSEMETIVANHPIVRGAV